MSLTVGEVGPRAGPFGSRQLDVEGCSCSGRKSLSGRCLDPASLLQTSVPGFSQRRSAQRPHFRVGSGSPAPLCIIR